MISLLIFLLLSCIAITVGRQVTQLARCSFVNFEEELAVSYSIGLVLLSTGVLWLGIEGLLDKKWLWLLVGTLGVFGASQWFFLVEVVREQKRKKGQEDRFLNLLLIGIAVVIVLGALVPPYDTDSLSYHLSTSASFLRMKRIEWIPNDINSHFPFFTEMLFLLGVALKDEALAQLFSWGLGIGTALAMVGFFRRFFGNSRWGKIAAIFFLLTPGIFNQMRQALVDVALSAYSFMGFYSLLVGVKTGKKGWLCLGCVFLAAATGIKYLALLCVGVTYAVFVIYAAQSHWTVRRILAWTGTLIVFISAISGFWYLKSYGIHGNPFYPYFNSLFGIAPLEIGGQVTGQYGHKAGMGNSILNFLTLPFNLTLFPTRFDGWGEQLGPAYLVFLPFAFWGRWSRERAALALYSFLYTVGWFCLAQVTRFLYPALPCLVLLLTNGIFGFQESRKRPATFVPRILTFVLFLNLALLLFHSRDILACLGSPGGHEKFLMKRERSFEMAKFVNENLPPDAKILCAEEARMYYFKRTVVRENIYRYRTHYDETARLSEMLERIKKDGFTHLLITQTDRAEPSAGIRRWISSQKENEGLELVHRTVYKERKGEKIEYTLFQLR